MNQKSLFRDGPTDEPEVGIPGWPTGEKPGGEWHDALSDVFQTEQWKQLCDFVRNERLAGLVFPGEQDVFRTFKLTRLSDVKFVLLGQDPYHGLGQAHGLSFSVNEGTKHPPSLVNIFKELVSDLEISAPSTGDLTKWARQGGLLLNTVLTVRAGEANSHRRMGWEQFTDRVIQVVNEHCENVAFILWGGPARKKAKLIDSNRHLIVESAHPSPLSSYRGFFGSKPFSKINSYRRDNGLVEIDWQLS